MNAYFPGSYPPAVVDPTFWRPNEPGAPGRPGYRAAIVCSRGHVLRWDVVNVPADDQGHCADCGARLLTRCAQCRRRIRGQIVDPTYVVYDEYVPPMFCDVCGEPHPWADRTARIYQLENILDEQDIDEATRLLVSDDLHRLRDEDHLTDQKQAEIWARVKERAPGLFTGTALPIARDLLTAYAKSKLGLS